MVTQQFYNRFLVTGEYNYPQHILASSTAINEIPAAMYMYMFSGVRDATVLHATSPEVVFMYFRFGGRHLGFAPENNFR